jgi:nitroimidazol reductase NimA-like FMN-containing flavoprotein (pyridoxamine 5'-phosphate oxidase superfamily)
VSDADPPPYGLQATPRTRLRRKRERGGDDWAAVTAVLDEGFLCHVGFVDAGTPYVVPMAYARVDDHLYFHGAAANRTLRTLATGVEACVTVTLLDGLVFARSAFHHSMNYRSVMLLGRGSRVEEEAEQLVAAAALLDHMARGRSADARGPSASELRSTLIVRFPVVEGSVKVRVGPPADDAEDMPLAVWAGEVPLHLAAGTPVPDDPLPPGVTTPAYALRPRQAGLGAPGR